MPLCQCGCGKFRRPKRRYATWECYLSLVQKQPFCKCGCGKRCKKTDAVFYGLNCWRKFMQATIPMCKCGCGKPCKRRRYQYASLKCQQQAEHTAYIERWLAGLETGIGAFGKTSRYVRRWVFERDGKRCVLCGWTGLSPAGTLALHCDHKDGNPENTTPNNMRSLCPTCHALTPTFAGANRGNGRIERRERYMRAHA